MPKRKTTKRKSDYNPDRLHYMSKDGKYYCYDILDERGRTIRTQKIEITPELEEITIIMDEMDYRSDLSDRYENELLDSEFIAKQERAFNEDEDDDLIESLPSNDVEEEAEDPMAEKVRAVVETEFTEEQQDLYYKHYGLCRQFEDIRQEEGRRTGKLPGAPAMTGRKDRMLNKVAKALGAEPPKPRKK